jgi:uncharacterized protein
VPVPIGFTLQPEWEFLELVSPLFERVDYFEVAPETLWALDASGELIENAYHRAFTAMRREGGKPFVAHGVGYSMASAHAGDEARRKKWLARIEADHRAFEFEWYTDHLGASSIGGLAVTLPLPVPMTQSAALVVASRLRELSAVVPIVGIENSVFYFTPGDPMDEPAFAGECLRPDGAMMVLDLNNVVTSALNYGFDPFAYAERFDLSRVIEIHVAGGKDSDPAWLGGRTFRLDSHDAAVPESVWSLLARVAPQCPNLRGITYERMEGTVTDRDVPAILGEVERLRAFGKECDLVRRARPGSRRDLPDADLAAYERVITSSLCASDPAASLRAMREVDPSLREHLAAIDDDGFRLTALLVARLRFERLVQGHAAADQWFEQDPRAFADAFRRYHAEVPPTAFFPQEEARLFSRWSG